MNKKIDKNKVNKVIFNFWNNFLNFKEIPVSWNNLTIIHNRKSDLPENQINILSFYNNWNIISVPKKYFNILSKYLNSNKYNIEKLLIKFESIENKKVQKFWPVIFYYLYNTNKLIPKNINVRQLKWIIDKSIFNEYIESCTKEEQNSVDMDFDDKTHIFFWLFIEKKLVSLWNYSIDIDTGISHIWILTHSKYVKNWYWKELVNTLVLDILEKGLIPQYRVKHNNIASIKLAESLWFEKVLEWITLMTVE